MHKQSPNTTRGHAGGLRTLNCSSDSDSGGAEKYCKQMRQRIESVEFCASARDKARSLYDRIAHLWLDPRRPLLISSFALFFAWAAALVQPEGTTKIFLIDTLIGTSTVFEQNVVAASAMACAFGAFCASAAPRSYIFCLGSLLVTLWWYMPSALYFASGDWGHAALFGALGTVSLWAFYRWTRTFMERLAERLGSTSRSRSA